MTQDSTKTTSGVLNGVSGISYGFGTRAEPLPAKFQARWDDLAPHKKQVHGVVCAEATAPGQHLGELDALYSRKAGIPISVVTADCVPVLLARADGGAVAAVHAGWRGTRAGILRALWDRLRSEGERPADWVAAIGPAIGPCCYEVSPDLAEDFAREFAWMGSSDAGIPRAVPKNRHLDLPLINAEELRKIGLGGVDLLRACTLCSKEPGFFSYRKDGSGHRQWSVIQIQNTRGRIG
jgi:YfiH family protein